MELFGIKLFDINLQDIKLLELSSLLFFTNFLHNTWHKEYPYAWLMLLLTVSSVFIHSGIFISESVEFQNQLIFLDRFIIVSIIIYGGSLFWKTMQLREVSFIPITTFLTIVYICLVGFFKNKYSFDLNNDMANISHIAIHILASLGHHVVIYEYGKLQWMHNTLLKNLIGRY